MKHTKEMLLIKVEDLVPSQYNVRCYSAGQVEEPAALIASQAGGGGWARFGVPRRGAT